MFTSVCCFVQSWALIFTVSQTMVLHDIYSGILYTLLARSPRRLICTKQSNKSEGDREKSQVNLDD